MKPHTREEMEMEMEMEITRELAWAASTDAGNRRMRAAGRTKWSVGDYNAAVREFNRLWPIDGEREQRCLCARLAGVHIKGDH